jgi:hypothetical protein
MKIFILALLLASTAHAVPTMTTSMKNGKFTSNNLRFFPFSLFDSNVHLQLDRSFSKHWVLGVEGSIATQTTHNNFMANYGFGRRESYYGASAQYYFDRSFHEWFIEAGAAYTRTEIESEIDPKPLEGEYFMPHASVGIREMTMSGINFGIAIGAYSLVGEPIRHQLSNGMTEELGYYNSSVHLRGRFDIGYTF